LQAVVAVVLTQVMLVLAAAVAVVVLEQGL
jgi:hypothetical protein